MLVMKVWWWKRNHVWLRCNHYSSYKSTLCKSTPYNFLYLASILQNDSCAKTGGKSFRVCTVVRNKWKWNITPLEFKLCQSSCLWSWDRLSCLNKVRYILSTNSVSLEFSILIVCLLLVQGHGAHIFLICWFCQKKKRKENDFHSLKESEKEYTFDVYKL